MKLRSVFDFSFMSRYGRVFQVYDDQDSGNICFGTEKDGRRYFVKFAGAPTQAYAGDPREAVDRLKAALRIQQPHGALTDENGYHRPEKSKWP